MDSYQGFASEMPFSNASFIQKNKFGAESFNFELIAGKAYGYFNHVGALKLERLGGGRTQNALNDVTIVWCAPKPGGGVFVVGWYKHATVYRNYEYQPAGPAGRSSLPRESTPCPWRVHADAANVRLLGPDDRLFKVPTAFVNQSLTRYLDENTASTLRLRRHLIQLVCARHAIVNSRSTAS